MKKNNTTTDTNKMNNTNNTMRMSKSKYHIVLRDKNNELVSWRGFADGDTAFQSFVGLYNLFNEACDGEIRDLTGQLGFVDCFGNKVVMQKTTAELVLEIIFCTRSSAEDIFRTYFKAE